MRGGAVWQLVGLITRRSQVQILPPLPDIRKPGLNFFPGFFVRFGWGGSPASPCDFQVYLRVVSNFRRFSYQDMAVNPGDELPGIFSLHFASTPNHCCCFGPVLGNRYMAAVVEAGVAVGSVCGLYAVNVAWS